MSSWHVCRWSGRKWLQEVSRGYALGIAGGSSCAECDAGYYTNERGEARCKECRVGQVAENVASHECEECPSGKFSAKPSQPCIRCNMGEYANKTGSSFCKACPSGWESDKERTLCEKCPAGFYESLSECNKCPSGFYSDETGSQNCHACPPGFVPGEDATECNKCRPGRWTRMDRNGVQICEDCSSGRFQSRGGCRNCSTGFVSSQGARECISVRDPNISSLALHRPKLDNSTTQVTWTMDLSNHAVVQQKFSIELRRFEIHYVEASTIGDRDRLMRNGSMLLVASDACRVSHGKWSHCSHRLHKLRLNTTLWLRIRAYLNVASASSNTEILTTFSDYAYQTSPCPANGVCGPSGCLPEEVRPRGGYRAAPWNPLDFVLCPQPSSRCPGATCSNGYEGVLCCAALMVGQWLAGEHAQNATHGTA